MKRQIVQGLVAILLASTAIAAEATPATSYYVYDEAGHVIGEYDQNGNPVQEHIYLGDRPVAVAVTSNNTTTVDYVTTDQLNTPRAVTDSSQTVDWSWSSDPFGNGQPTGSLTYNLRFPGQYYDAETGHNYNYLRDYDPSVGRYVESDPIGLEGGLNTYRYVLGNPIRFIDEQGTATLAIPLDVTIPPWALPEFLPLLPVLALPLLLSGDTPCDRDKQCGEQLEMDYATCDAIYRAEKVGKRPSGAYNRCMNSAHQRYANCLRGQAPGTLDAWNN